MVKPKPTEQADKTERLRAQRLADEAARKEAGTWGNLMVGEIVHPASGSVYVQVWKGARRPDPLRAPSPQAAGVPAEDWPAIAAWAKATRFAGHDQRIVGWSLSKAEAAKLKEASIARHRAAGLNVINQPVPEK